MVQRISVAIFLTVMASTCAMAAPPEAPDAAKPTLEARLLAENPATLARSAREKGDPVNGAMLFYQAQLTCVSCHVNKGKEPPLGPDLARPEKGTTDAYLVESILNPSKVIRKGFETATVTRIDGTTITGLLIDDNKDAVVVRDPARDGQKQVIAKRDIDEWSKTKASIMPSGLINQFSDRKQFLDLLSYVLEVADFGTPRARALRPDSSVINPRLPAYEGELDHAGLIAEFNDSAFRRGKKLYERICANCHGIGDQPGSMPTSLRFTSGQFKNGFDPYAMYQTLTRGYGMMAPQHNLVPQQKYDVIHYIREAFLKNSNRSQYANADTAYLAKLPKGTSRGPKPADSDPWLKADYGPTLIGSFEASADGPNIGYKGIAVRLDSGPGGIAAGKTWMMYDHDTLRVVAGWSGQEFIDWNGINFNGRHEIHPRIAGQLQFETSVGPGWANPETGRFEDPRVLGRDGRRYGPLPRSWAHYRGLYHAGDQAILSYTVGDTRILESPGRLGTESAPIFTRVFNLGARSKDLVLQVARQPSGATLRTLKPGQVVVFGHENDRAKMLTAGIVNPPKAAGFVSEDRDLRYRIPAGQEPLRFTLWLSRGLADDGSEAIAKSVADQRPTIDLASRTQGGPPRWTKTIATNAELGRDDGSFTVDTLTAPAVNPWHCQMRLTGIDFLPDGKRAIVCSWDGDVWQVSGLDQPEVGLSWRRIASGLFQPLGLKFVGSKIFVGCRDQICILHDLNGDGEIDFYENFNSDHQVTESFHEFAMGLQTDAEGNFYYAKAARHGKPAVVPHHGTLLRVSRDGLRTDILATGFRAPNGVCVNPDGTFFLTDQEGHWIPKNRINWVRPGHFYGNMWGYHDVTDPSNAAMDQPLCWITNRFDRSPAELLRVDSKAWGALNGGLLNLSYGHGKIYVVPQERVGDMMQGGMCALPIPLFPTGIMRGRFNPADGHLYACGMYAWAGNQQQPGGFFRIRATGKPAYLPVGFHARRDGLAITFSDALEPQAATEPGNFGLKTWSLRRSADYGSPHVGERAVRVRSAKLSEDRRTVLLDIPDLHETQCLELWYSILGIDGKEVDGILHGTIHQMGK